MGPFLSPMGKGKVGAMNIDAHQHFWAPARGDYFWMGAEAARAIRRDVLPADFAPHRKAHRIDRTVLVQAAATIEETEYMLGIADATVFVAKVVGWWISRSGRICGSSKGWRSTGSLRA